MAAHGPRCRGGTNASAARMALSLVLLVAAMASGGQGLAGSFEGQHDAAWPLEAALPAHALTAQGLAAAAELVGPPEPQTFHQEEEASPHARGLLQTQPTQGGCYAASTTCPYIVRDVVDNTLPATSFATVGSLAVGIANGQLQLNVHFYQGTFLQEEGGGGGLLNPLSATNPYLNTPDYDDGGSPANVRANTVWYYVPTTCSFLPLSLAAYAFQLSRPTCQRDVSIALPLPTDPALLPDCRAGSGRTTTRIHYWVRLSGVQYSNNACPGTNAKPVALWAGCPRHPFERCGYLPVDLTCAACTTPRPTPCLTATSAAPVVVTSAAFARVGTISFPSIDRARLTFRLTLGAGYFLAGTTGNVKVALYSRDMAPTSCTARPTGAITPALPVGTAYPNSRTFAACSQSVVMDVPLSTLSTPDCSVAGARPKTLYLWIAVDVRQCAVGATQAQCGTATCGRTRLWAGQRVGAQSATPEQNCAVIPVTIACGSCT